ncbi:MAG: translational GTPase TypA [Candidatus Onthovivens sp.]|nr:translational GTPase TypA [Mollicutes bacterium]MDY4857929.1 translational GTPase TypA [Candidatus Onthovivens sp.]
MNLRNIAIIAHVDHGKTTLVNQLLKSSGTFRENEKLEDRAMDSNDIERERGITILAKTTSIKYKDTKINILDTPGHADFGGEVERIMHMVDGCLLLVDAFEGTMPQTRFVLKKALEAHVKPIVVINKIDRPNANPKKAVDEVLSLFIELGAPEEFLDFQVAYTSALNGTSSLSPNPNDQKPGMDPIFDLILKEIPEPPVDINKPLQLQFALLDYNDYVGRMGIGRIQQGSIKVNQMVSCARLDGTVKNFKVLKLIGYYGLKKIEIEEAHAGEIVAVAGLPDIYVGETVCELNNINPLPPLHIDEPTLQMTFGTNSSPFSGKDGKLLTARKIEERLFKEKERDVSLKVERVLNSESWIVSGRGELHLGILIENMRREGFELEVSRPQVIIKEIDGCKCEPYEDLSVEVPNDFVGDIMTSLGSRDAELIDMTSDDSNTKINYVIPSRGLIGFVTNFLTLTKGYGIIAHTFKEYRPCKEKSVGERQIGVLVATEKGTSTPYALQHVEDRGIMFVGPGVDVYEGMIVGENKYDSDLAVNVCQTKNLTNQRSANKDQTVVLKVPRKMTLEACLDYINSDELVEITPSTFRMRKKILNTAERKKWEAKNK